MEGVLTDVDWRTIGRAMDRQKMRICPVCETQFHSGDSKQRYCTRECSRRAAQVRLYFLLRGKRHGRVRTAAYRERLRIYKRIR